MGNVVRAKMKCHYIGEPAHGNVSVQLGAVYSPDPNHENHTWSKFTPSGSLTLSISEDKPAAKMFKVGTEYLIDIVEVVKEVE